MGSEPSKQSPGLWFYGGGDAIQAIQRCRCGGDSQIDCGRDAACVERVLRSKRIVARADLVHLVQYKHIANLNVFKPGHGNQIALGHKVGAASDGRNCIVTGLRFEQGQRSLARADRVRNRLQSGRGGRSSSGRRRSRGASPCRGAGAGGSRPAQVSASDKGDNGPDLLALALKGGVSDRRERRPECVHDIERRTAPTVDCVASMWIESGKVKV